MKRRIAYLEVDGKRFGGERSGLNISFDVPYCGSAFIPTNASFVLTNANRHDTEQIVTNTSRFIERKRQIKFWAGYEGNVKQIYGGQILRSVPADMPDTNINITAQALEKAMGKYIERNWENPMFIDLIREAATACDFDLCISEQVRSSDKLMKRAGHRYEYSGGAVGYLREIMTDLGSVIVTNNDGMAFCVANNILYVSFQSEPYPASIPIINKNTGLIGIPSPTDTGVNLQILMDVTLSPFQTIRLESERMPLYNGFYNIINIRHHGTLRGRDWYSDLECCTVNTNGWAA